MKTNKPLAIALTLFFVFFFVSCSNMFFQKNKTLTFSLPSLESLSRDAGENYYTYECLIKDKNNNTIEKYTPNATNNGNVVFKIDGLKKDDDITVVVNLCDESNKRKICLGKDDVKVGSKNEVNLSAYSVQNFHYTKDEENSGEKFPKTVETNDASTDPFRTIANSDASSIDTSTKVYAWEMFDGMYYHYYFENDKLPQYTYNESGIVEINEVLLTLGDIVLDNHRIIPTATTREIPQGNTPIGVLASLQENDGPYVPLRVLSYKYKTGLAWCKDESVPGYNVHCEEPENFANRPIQNTGKYYFYDHFLSVLENENPNPFKLSDYPIFEEATKIKDGDLEWYIPHGWEIQGNTTAEIMNNSGYEYLNTGLTLIKEAGYETLQMNATDDYWSSTLPKDNKDDDLMARAVHFNEKNNWGWSSYDKTSTAPTTIFMAILN